MDVLVIQTFENKTGMKWSDCSETDKDIINKIFRAQFAPKVSSDLSSDLAGLANSLADQPKYQQSYEKWDGEDIRQDSKDREYRNKVINQNFNKTHRFDPLTGSFRFGNDDDWMR
jgi:hypothetical protein